MLVLLSILGTQQCAWHAGKLRKCLLDGRKADWMEGRCTLPCFVLQAVKTQLLEQAQGQLMELLDQAMWEAVQAYPPQDRPVPSIPPDSLHK